MKSNLAALPLSFTTAYLLLSPASALPAPAQQAYLKATNTEAPDWFGSSVAISGNTAVIGAPLEDSNASTVNGDQSNNNAINSGAAYILVRTGTNWSHQAYLKASNGRAEARFGHAVAASGGTVVVAAFAESSRATGVNGDQQDQGATNAGAAYVFVREGNSWSQQAYVKASNTKAGDHFGTSVAICADTMVIGAPYEDNNALGVNGTGVDTGFYSERGAAYVFVRNGSN